jgi:hypothetical protein
MTSTTSHHDARALHLIDLENLAGGPWVSADAITATWAAYRGGVPVNPSDHVVVGSSSIFAKKAWFVLPATGVQRRVRDGRDGGELSMLEDFDLPTYATRFPRLVIASGDGIFTETAMRARDHGMHVHLVLGHGLPARALLDAVATRAKLRLGVAESMHLAA